MENIKINDFNMVYIDIGPRFTYSAYKDHCFYGYIQLINKGNKVILNASKEFLMMIDLHNQLLIENTLLKKLF